MSIFAGPSEREADARPWILAAALTATVATYFFMDAYFEWSAQRQGLNWVYVQYAVLMGVPFAAGLLAWWRWGVGGLLAVSLFSASGTGARFVNNSFDAIQPFADLPFEESVAIVFTSMLSALSVGLLLPLAFAVYQLWPVRDDRIGSWDEQVDRENSHRPRQKVVDERFVQ